MGADASMANFISKTDASTQSMKRYEKKELDRALVSRRRSQSSGASGFDWQSVSASGAP
jgi:hypothetical protein